MDYLGVFTTLVVGIGLFGPVASAIAQSAEAETSSNQPIAGEQTPLPDAPPVLSDEQRALVEQALKKSHLPVPIETVPSESGPSPTSPPSQLEPLLADSEDPSSAGTPTIDPQ